MRNGAPGCTFSNVELKIQTWRAWNILKTKIRFFLEFVHEIFWFITVLRIQSATFSSTPLTPRCIIKMEKILPPSAQFDAKMTTVAKPTNSYQSCSFCLDLSATFPVAVTMTTRHKRSLSSLFLGFSLMFLSLMKHQLTYQGLPVVLSPFVVSDVLYLSFTHPADTEQRLLFI